MCPAVPGIDRSRRAFSHNLNRISCSYGMTDPAFPSLPRSGLSWQRFDKKWLQDSANMHDEIKWNGPLERFGRLDSPHRITRDRANEAAVRCVRLQRVNRGFGPPSRSRRRASSAATSLHAFAHSTGFRNDVRALHFRCREVWETGGRPGAIRISRPSAGRYMR